MWLRFPRYLTTVAALLGTFVGYHVMGPWGAVLALVLSVAFILVMARRQQDRTEREKLRRMVEWDELR